MLMNCDLWPKEFNTLLGQAVLEKKKDTYKDQGSLYVEGEEKKVH